MQTFESMVGLLVVAVGLAALARRWNVPYPALLAGLGIVLALVPGMPPVVLDPQLALALFVAPVLLDAAYDTSTRDLRANWVPITGLVLIAVGVTTATVAWATKAMVPDLPWSAAVALGAIVAPPDAAAASAVLNQTRLPHRLNQILEGESLFNDATALLIYRMAVATAMGKSVSIAQAVPTLAVVVVGSLVAGFATARVFRFVTMKVDDIPTSIVLQFAGTFGVWIATERVGLSGILTVVAYAITIARHAPHTTPARIRVPSYAVWETMVFVLNVLAFVVIGLQLGPIIEQLSSSDRSTYAQVAAIVLAVVIGSRVVWVMLYNTAMRWRHDHSDASPDAPERPTVRGGILVSWCGMRGIVTLAAALALPAAFPGRPLILVTAFTVVVGTLMLQGLTLPALLRVLDLRDDGPVEREVDQAREAALRAALTTLDGNASDAARALRFELEELLADVADDGTSTSAQPTLPALRQGAVDAARAELKRMRFNDSIGDDAYHQVELVLDRTELYAQSGRP